MTSSPRTLLVCQNVNCIRHNGKAVLAAFQAADLPDDVVVEASDCLGQCNMAPNARLVPDEVWYCRLTPEDVPQIVTEHLHNGEPVEAKLHPRIHPRFSV
ncbi:(2Fe-2S) ferredoxin domain-containing protein [Spirulina major]|uniref:(2Fe-2S) ferredoxin domain-containing protein n=1 Tax=Spirulina major TaxID=270636 RepID=UPI0009348B5F|nr:(2Fe-2S) ferredoxin domain-containing protein [Spirulina major]